MRASLKAGVRYTLHQYTLFGRDLQNLAKGLRSFPTMPRRERIINFTQAAQIWMGIAGMYGIFSFVVHTAFLTPFMVTHGLYIEGPEFAQCKSWLEVVAKVLFMSQLYSVCANVCFHRFFAHNCFETSSFTSSVLATVGTPPTHYHCRHHHHHHHHKPPPRTPVLAG